MPISEDKRIEFVYSPSDLPGYPGTLYDIIYDVQEGIGIIKITSRDIPSIEVSYPINLLVEVIDFLSKKQIIDKPSFLSTEITKKSTIPIPRIEKKKNSEIFEKSDTEEKIVTEPFSSFDVSSDIVKNKKEIVKDNSVEKNVKEDVIAEKKETEKENIKKRPVYRGKSPEELSLLRKKNPEKMIKRKN